MCLNSSRLCYCVKRKRKGKEKKNYCDPGVVGVIGGSNIYWRQPIKNVGTWVRWLTIRWAWYCLDRWRCKLSDEWQQKYNLDALLPFCHPCSCGTKFVHIQTCRLKVDVERYCVIKWWYFDHIIVVWWPVNYKFE